MSTEIRFDGWSLHCGSGELAKGSLRVRLPAQPLLILEELLAHPGEVVTREQLVARLWPRGVVEYDTALNSAVRRLRTALGDSAATARYIETIPKRGYRFIGTLDPPVATPVAVSGGGNVARSTRTGPQHWRVAAAFVLGLATMLVVVAGVEPAAEPLRSPTVTRSGAAGPGSVVAEANERYARARHLLQRRGPGDVAASLDNFAEAVAIDPSFARAWAGLASAYWIETVEGRLPAPEGLANLRAAAEKALGLDPRLAEAHLRLANYWSRVGRRDLVALHKSAALDAEPDHPLALSFGASMAADEGRYDRAIELQRRAVAAEPLSVPSRYNLAVWLYLAGRPAEAREEWSAIREIDPGASDPGGMIGLSLVLERRFDSVLALAKHGTRNTEGLQALAMAYSALGRTVEADRTLAELLEASDDADPLRIAEVYAFRGQPDLAFEWLRAAAERDGLYRCGESTCWPLEMAERLPFLAPLHSDPRWQDWRDSVRRRQSALDSARRG